MYTLNINNKKMDKYEELDKLLYTADWYYMRSEDNRAYERGHQIMGTLIQMRINLPDQDKAIKIWNKHTPFSKITNKKMEI